MKCIVIVCGLLGFSSVGSSASSWCTSWTSSCRTRFTRVRRRNSVRCWARCWPYPTTSCTPRSTHQIGHNSVRFRCRSTPTPTRYKPSSWIVSAKYAGSTHSISKANWCTKVEVNASYSTTIKYWRTWLPVNPTSSSKPSSTQFGCTRSWGSYTSPTTTINSPTSKPT